MCICRMIALLSSWLCSFLASFSIGNFPSVRTSCVHCYLKRYALLCCVIAVAILQYSCVCLVIFGVFCCAARRFVRHSFISLEILGFRWILLRQVIDSDSSIHLRWSSSVSCAVTMCLFLYICCDLRQVSCDDCISFTQWVKTIYNVYALARILRLTGPSLNHQVLLTSKECRAHCNGSQHFFPFFLSCVANPNLIIVLPIKIFVCLFLKLSHC